jgi:hypothetical protein
MNSLKKIIYFIILSALFACTADKNDNRTAMVSVEIDALWGSGALALNQPITFNGQTFTFTTARFYMSEITLHRANGTTERFSVEPLSFPAKDGDTDVQHTVTDHILLVKHDANETEYELGEAPTGTYSAISFKVGLGGLTNHIDVTAAPAGHVLAKQTENNNHWSWNSGFIFFKVEGKYDTDGDNQINDDSRWRVHLGTDQYLAEVKLNQEFTIEGGVENALHLMIDYQKVIEPFTTGLPDTHTFSNPTQAQTVFNLLDNVFELHGVHTHNH